MAKSRRRQFIEEDVIKGRIDHLIEHRAPWLLVGLLGGILATLVVSRYEEILSADVRLAFFIPVIVYLSDALGTQTETIYVRELSERKRFHVLAYLVKEILIGFGMGAISGMVLGLLSAYWFSSPRMGVTIGLTMLANLTIAPLLAILIPSLLQKEHLDPALGSGPVATVIQDLISLVVYFIIASAILF